MSESVANENTSGRIPLSEKVIVALSVSVTACTIIWVLWLSNYGLDLTDESFYLVWISNPFNYSVSATQFGFIYHPLYLLLDGNIVALRQANILITFFLAWVLVDVFLKTVLGSKSLQRKSRAVISGSIATAATASLVFAGLWLPTPSYNSLALQALLIAAIGFLMADKRATRESAIGWFLIGVGGWLAFMAKPTTTAALGLITSIYLLFAGKFSIRLLAMSAATAAGSIVLVAFAIDGSIIAFIDRLKGGTEMYSILSSGHTTERMLRLDDFQLGERGRLVFIAFTGIFFSAAYFAQVKAKILMHGSASLSVGFALASIAIISEVANQIPNVGQFQGLLIWTIPFASMLTGFSIYRSKGLAQISRPEWALALTFLVLPHVYAFGTDGNYWVSASIAGVFWILAGLVFLKPIAPDRRFLPLLLSLGLASQLITVLLIHKGIETPYRQPQPLRDNDYKLEIGKPASSLVLSEDFGQYIREAIFLAKRAGFAGGTPMIDLTGQSPGILYAIGASNIGQPWTVGGYPGSETLAIAMLRKVACQELAVAWLLVEPEGPRKISPQILSSFGGNLSEDFEIAGTLRTARGAGGYGDARVQFLLKPLREVEHAVNSCISERTKNK